jgi:threonyl-tRNA synthetase
MSDPNKSSWSAEDLEHLRHSAAHLLAAAVMELWPDTKRTIGPAIDNGFYYDFEFQNPISESDLKRIEEKMRQIVKSWDKFDCLEVSKDEALNEVADNPYKRELIEEFSKDGQQLSIYQSGNFRDLCRGGHVENPKEALKHFKLLSIAGAYWRGDEKNTMLTRIYGTIWPSKEELDHYLWQLEEAKKRDHRKIGKEQELFFIDDIVGKGLIMWLPKGTIIRDQIESLARQMEAEHGYLRVVTPHIAKEELFLKSGHLPYYKDSMFPGMKMDDGTYYLKAMNCPHHHRIFQSRPRSYREMPVRLAEYGTCYRNELSGTLAGLLRVRALAMNDAHLYVTRDQVKEEFAGVLKLTMEYFKIFGLKDYWFRLSKWSPEHTEKYINQPENWEYTQQVLREVLDSLGVKYVEADDEAAFYGPKVDVQFKSVIGREETMSTIQLDFAAKERFGLNYIDSEGKENNEVFVIHRAPLSVHERFLAFLIEHFAGAFPVWLSPVQTVIIPISQDQGEYAKGLQNKLKVKGIRVELLDEAESMQKKIRNAEKQKIPYMLIVGKQEVADNSVSVRGRGEKNLGAMPQDKFISIIKDQIAIKSLE